MNRPPVIRTENGRVAALKSYEVLDTISEQEFDNIAQLTADICNTPIALINLIDEHRQWFKSSVGITAKQLPRENSFCHFTILDDEIFEVTNPLADNRFNNYSLVTGEAGIRFYAGVPLIAENGYRIGTLCVMSPRHHQLNSYQRIAMGILASAVMAMLETRKQKRETDNLLHALDSSLAIAVVNADNDVEYVNATFCNLAGLSAEEIYDRKYNNIKLSDLSPDEAADIAEAINAGKGWNGLVRNQNIRGSLTWCKLVVVPLLYPDGTLNKVIYLLNDATAAIQAGDRLNETEKLAGAGSWELNVFNRSTAWTDGLFRLFGYDPQTEKGQEQSVMNFVSPADLDKVNEVNKKLLEKRSNEEHLEFGIVTNDGTPKTVSAIVKKRYNSKGSLTSIFGTIFDVSNTAAFNKQLNAKEHTLQLLHNNAQVGFLSVDAGGFIVDANGTFLRWADYLKDELIGNIRFADLLSGEMKAAFETAHARLIETGAANELKVKIYRKIGGYLIGKVTSGAVRDAEGRFLYAVITVSDITESFEKDKLLQEQNERISNSIYAADLLMYTTNPLGACVAVSPRLLAFVGLNQNEVLGEVLPFVFDNQWRDKVGAHFSQLLLHYEQETPFHYPVRNRSGERVWVEGESFPVLENGKVTGLRHLLRDITNYIQAEEQLSEVALMALEAKDKHLGLISDINEQVKHPLHGITGMVNLLMNTNLALEQKVLLEGIKGAAAKIMTELDHLTHPAQLQPTPLTSDQRVFDLKATVKNTLNQKKADTDNSNIRFILQVDNKIPTHVYADPELLNKIIISLLDNALSRTTEGSISLMVMQNMAGEQAMVLEFIIKDNGSPLPASQVQEIMGYVQRTGATASVVNESTLPLTIARQLVEQHDGVFKMRSDKENGTAISFTYHIQEPQNAGAQPSNNGDEPERPFEGMNFLFVEDNTMSQRVGKGMLENWGATVTLADGGRPALELLERFKFQLIFMDLKMPDLSGIETTVIIRQELKLNTPILAMTVSETQTKREACIKAGMNDYILKPLNAITLRAKMNKLLNLNDVKTTERLTNIEYIKTITNNDSSLMKEVLEIYVNRTPALIQEIDNDIAAGRYQQAQANIHYLKNSVGLLGADTLFHTLANIEERLNHLPLSSETILLIRNMKEIVEESIQETNEELKML